MPQISSFLAMAALVFGLALLPASPEIGNVVTIGVMLIGVGLMIAFPLFRTVMRQPASFLPALAGVVLFVALLPTARSPMHLASILVLGPVWFAGGMARMLATLGPRLSPGRIGALALAGSLLCTLISAYDVFVRGLDRGGVLVLNPVHMGNLGLLLGLAASAGLFVLDRRWRVLFLLGPALACATAWLTGSRGALVALGPLLMVVLSALSLQMLPRRLAVWFVIAVGIGLSLAMVSGFWLGLLDGIRGVAEIRVWLETGVVNDPSTGQRLAMYQGAWEAFLASPLYGHGMIDFVQFAAERSSLSRTISAFEHLHSDLADFAVIGGLLGIASLLLALVAPLVGGLATRGANRSVAIYLGTTTTASFLFIGLTNATFGILVLTVPYMMLTACIAALDTDSGSP